MILNCTKVGMAALSVHIGSMHIANLWLSTSSEACNTIEALAEAIAEILCLQTRHSYPAWYE